MRACYVSAFSQETDNLQFPPSSDERASECTRRVYAHAAAAHGQPRACRRAFAGVRSRTPPNPSVASPPSPGAPPAALRTPRLACS
eukprot:3015566-Pleurochrysis_carterae.AAC.2